MKKETFLKFWEEWSSNWINFSIKCEGKIIPFSSLCSLRPKYGDKLYESYNIIKGIIKDSYFKDTSKRLSKYKRAAIIAYVINGSHPLEYCDKAIEDDLDPHFLKQRLAFYVALGSIVQGYSQQEVEKLKKPYFDFYSLGRQDIVDNEDDFLLSVYKDLFFSEIYKNYNVLTMANVFGLLVERASKLSELTPLAELEQP